MSHPTLAARLWTVTLPLIALAFPSLGNAAAAAAEVQKPNIVFVLADDIGYGDLSCYGATLVHTKNLDRLARQGCRFTDAHSPASTCTPTRYALLTGQYAWRHAPGSRILPGDAPLSIAPGSATLPALLQRVGYKTGVVGKWHLGLGGKDGPDWNGAIEPGPLDVGFDYAFIMPATGDRVPCVYVENRRVVGLDPKDPIRVSYRQKVCDEPTGRENSELLKLKPTHGHDMTIVNGVSRIGWMSGGKAAHWVDEDMADTYVKKAVAFLEKNKAGPFFLYLALHDIHVPRVPHPRFKGTSKCGTRGDAIQEMDAAVGEVLAALERLKLTDNTLFIFTSDNGGVMDDGYADFGSLEHKCNGALNGRKGTLYEGGHRIPFLARWPGKIKAGATSDALFAHVDMAATFAALTDVPLPADAVPDSFNVLPALLGEKTDKPLRDHLILHIGGTAGPMAVRQGPWKLITPRPKDKSGPMLFNLADDLGEKKNLAATMPDKVKELSALLKKCRSEKQTRPPTK
jgi:arylsulfatase A-like enzyme